MLRVSRCSATQAAGYNRAVSAHFHCRPVVASGDPARRGRRRQSTGFTLIELIVLMILVGILAVAVLPRFSGLTAFSARGYADQIESYLRFAQKTAVAGRRTTRLELVDCTVGDGACNTAPRLCVTQAWAATSSCATACPASPGTCSGGWCAMALPGKFRSPQNRVALSGAGNVCFDTLGSAVGGGRVLTFNDDTGALARTVTIESTTGYVH